MSQVDETVKKLAAFCADNTAHLNVPCEDIAALCNRYARAIELLRLLDVQARFRGARNPDVAVFLDGEVAP